MRYRWLLALGLGLAVTALWAGTAFADAVYHAAYNNTTNRCGSCHRAHTAQGDALIKTDTIYNLCTSCHGSTNGLDAVDGLEFATNPDHSIIAGTGEPTKGAGFTNSSMNTSLVATIPAGGVAVAAKATTSNHMLIDAPSGAGAGVVYGLGAINSGAGASFAMTCVTCHDPHGQSGAPDATHPNGTPTYRILRGTKGLSDPAAPEPAGRTTVDVPDVTVKDYVVTNTVVITADVYYGVNYPTGSDLNTDNGNMVALSNWCAGCHQRLNTASDGYSGDSIYMYRHKTNDSNISLSAANGAPGCLTCHTAHGSSATVTANQVPVPGSTTAYLGSSLLRVDNRGVCELCHNK